MKCPKCKSEIVNDGYCKNCREQELLLEKLGDEVLPLSNREEAYSKYGTHVLDKLAVMTELQIPQDVVDWLNQNISQYKKGVFLIQMERGTGKSSLARTLDELSIAKQDLLPDNFVTRTYYLKDIIYNQLSYFAQGLTDIFKYSKDNAVMDDIPFFDCDTETPQKELAKVLNCYLEAYKEATEDKNKLLFVLDGIDEIPTTTVHKRKIIDFIPEPDQLEEGIYILITSRTNSELEDKGLIKTRLSQLTFTNSAVYESTRGENVKAIKGLVESKFGTVSNDLFMWLLMESDYRFDHLELLTSMLESTEKAAEDSFGSSVQIFEDYLRYLEKNCDKEYFQMIKDFIISLSIAPEPLTARELSILLDGDGFRVEYSPTFRVLFLMVELRGVLKIERGYRRNLLSLYNPEWAEAVLKLYKDEIKNKVKKLYNKSISTIELDLPWWKEMYDGETYLIAWCWDLVFEYIPELRSDLLNRRVDKGLNNIVDGIFKNSSAVYLWVRASRILAETIYMKKELNSEGNLEDLNELAKDIMKYGGVKYYLNKYDDAVKSFQQAFEVFEKLDEKQEDKELLALMLQNYGVLFSKLESAPAAISYFESASSYFGELQDSNKTESGQYANFLINRALARTEEDEEMWEDFKKSIEIFEELGRHNDLAYCYFGKGSRLINQGMEKEGVEHLNEAIKLMRSLDEKSELKDRNNLAKALECRSSCEIISVSDALNDLNKALNIIKENRDTGYLYDKKCLAEILANRSNRLMEVDKHEEAKSNLEEAVDLIQELENENDEVWNGSDLRSYALMLLGVNELLDQKTAKEYLEEAIKIMKQLKEEFKLKEELNLAFALFHYGTNEEVDRKEAQESIKEVVEIMKVLYEEGDFDHKDFYLETLWYIVKDKELEKEELRYYLEQTVNILEDLGDSATSEDKHDLAAVMVNWVQTFDRDELNEKLLEYTDEAIEILKELENQGDLAEALGTKAFILRDLGKHYLAKLDEAIDILKELESKKELNDYDLLSTFQKERRDYDS